MRTITNGWAVILDWSVERIERVRWSLEPGYGKAKHIEYRAGLMLGVF